MNYTNHLVAFLDILGFSELTLESENSIECRDAIQNIFQKCDDVRDSFSELTGKKKIKSMVMSDSIVLALELSSPIPSPKELANFFLASGQVQYCLSEIGVWIRGGIAVGPLEFDANQKQVVGPSLVNAVRLEKSARYPRVVVDPKILSAAKIQTAEEFFVAVNGVYQANNQRPLFEWRNWFDDLGVNILPHDVPFFIDFVRSPVGNPNLLIIAEHIAKGLTGSIQHYDKYRWLADYILASNRQMNFGHTDHDQKLNSLLS